MRSKTSAPRSHSPVFLLPAGSIQIVRASGQRQHALDIEQENARNSQVLLVVSVLIQFGELRYSPIQIFVHTSRPASRNPLDPTVGTPRFHCSCASSAPIGMGTFQIQIQLSV